MTGFLDDPALEALLERLHARSEADAAATGDYFRARAAAGRTDFTAIDDADHAHFADKLVALDRDKAQFCHGLCRAIGARRIVEVGTSFGVSTLYLAAAVRDAGGGLVVATEQEAKKAAAARANFAAAGLERFIDLREGDLRLTLRRLAGPIDFALFDIWTEMARPALELIAPALRPGAVVCADNTARARDGYRAWFEFVDDPANGFRTITLPFEGGFEMTVKLG